LGFGLFIKLNSRQEHFTSNLPLRANFNKAKRCLPRTGTFGPEKAKPKNTKECTQDSHFPKKRGKIWHTFEKGKKTDEGDIPRQTSCTLESCPG
jgi:hypothetical protein